jgi:hypothetical protein
MQRPMSVEQQLNAVRATFADGNGVGNHSSVSPLDAPLVVKSVSPMKKYFKYILFGAVALGLLFLFSQRKKLMTTKAARAPVVPPPSGPRGSETRNNQNSASSMATAPQQHPNPNYSYVPPQPTQNMQQPSYYNPRMQAIPENSSSSSSGQDANFTPLP